MKKVLAIMLTLIMLFSINSVAFAMESDTSNIMVNDVTQDIQPRLITYLDFSGTLYSGTAKQFTVGSRINLKLSMAASQTCRVWLYNRNTGKYVKLDGNKDYLEIVGGATAATYSLKSNCAAGSYQLEFYCDNNSCYAAYTLSGTAYA